jgi:P-type E1-E2 ATPase
LLAERGPREPPATSRSTASIVRANVFTLFNLILIVFGALTLAFADPRDALFLGIVVFNSGIGIFQELRAKRALDRLAALVVPTATVVRDGRPRELPVEDVLVGDVVRLAPGDQVVADGELVEAQHLALDESILTGESVTVERDVGESVRSGSFAVEGAAAFVVSAVGADSYAERLAGEARRFRHAHSPLERALNRLLLVLVGAMVPLGVMLGYALYHRHVSTRAAISTATAGVVTLVPEGLILLTSLTFAVAALKMARRGALAQQLNAVESLASADVVCLDKTGTLTMAELRVVEAVPDSIGGLLGRFAASSPSRNTTLAAIAAAFPAEAEPLEGSVPFSSSRRWSGLQLDGEAYVLGAPDLLSLDGLADRVAAEAAQGRRVLALARASALPAEDSVPTALEPLGLVVLAERLRPETRATVEYFSGEGISLCVLSGDAPETVAAIAADAGILSAGPPLAGDGLPDDPAALREAVAASAVVGRITPEGKRLVVEALRGGGRYVAMVGDGVNDVPALKAAQLAIAQGTGSDMARAVSDLVLVSGDFASVPPMVHEGRQVLRNLQRVAKLFVTKSVFAAFLILTVGLTPTSYPFLPRHLTLASSLTIGIPAFFLALAPSQGPWRPDRFLREVAGFAVPAGVAAGLGVVSAYLFSLNVLDFPLESARTVATSALVLIGLSLVYFLEAGRRRARNAAVLTLCGLLLGAYVLVLLLPFTRSFFALALPTAGIVVCSLGGAALAIGGLWLMDFGRTR